MMLSIKKIIKISGVLFLVLSLTACTKHKEGDGHNHGSETKKEATEKEEHDESEEEIATLNDEQIKAVGITFGKIEERQLTATIKANGFLKVPNNSQANATSLFGGVIKSLPIEIGDYVKKGQVIARIENPQFVQLQEEYMTIKNNISLTEQEIARQKELNEGGAGALKNLQNVDTQIKNFRARKASLEKQIQLMGINPATISNSNLQASLNVTSPVSGTVSNIFAKIGSYVDVSSPVAEIVDNSKLHLDLQVFEKDLPKLKMGQTIYFTLTNNPTEQYSATIFSIGSSFENDSKTVAVHSEVTGNKKGLINGMNVTGLISLEKASTPSVPNDAIVGDGGKYYIFVLSDKETEHEHKEGESHDHAKEVKQTRFEKVEILKGTSEAGYTAITLVSKNIPADAKIATKGAFFINAKLSNTEGHAH